MNKRRHPIRPRAFLVSLLVIASLAAAPISRAADVVAIVHVDTPLGSFELELFPDVAPVTVANFLEYVTDGDFTDSFIHRSVPGFTRPKTVKPPFCPSRADEQRHQPVVHQPGQQRVVIQGGGFTFNADAITGARWRRLHRS